MPRRSLRRPRQQVTPSNSRSLLAVVDGDIHSKDSIRLFDSDETIELFVSWACSTRPVPTFSVEAIAVPGVVHSYRLGLICRHHMVRGRICARRSRGRGWAKDDEVPDLRTRESTRREAVLRLQIGAQARLRGHGDTATAGVERAFPRATSPAESIHGGDRASSCGTCVERNAGARRARRGTIASHGHHFSRGRAGRGPVDRLLHCTPDPEKPPVRRAAGRRPTRRSRPGLDVEHGVGCAPRLIAEECGRDPSADHDGCYADR